jgi:hypothetical protein
MFILWFRVPKVLILFLGIVVLFLDIVILSSWYLIITKIPLCDRLIWIRRPSIKNKHGDNLFSSNASQT